MHKVQHSESSGVLSRVTGELWWDWLELIKLIFAVIWVIKIMLFACNWNDALVALHPETLITLRQTRHSTPWSNSCECYWVNSPSCHADVKALPAGFLYTFTHSKPTNSCWRIYAFQFNRKSSLTYLWWQVTEGSVSNLDVDNVQIPTNLFNLQEKITPTLLH